MTALVRGVIDLLASGKIAEARRNLEDESGYYPDTNRESPYNQWWIKRNLPTPPCALPPLVG